MNGLIFQFKKKKFLDSCKLAKFIYFVLPGTIKFAELVVIIYN